MKLNQMKSKWVIGAGVVLVLLVIALLAGLFGRSGSRSDLGVVKKGSASAVSKDADRKGTLVVYADDVTGAFNPVYAQGSGDEAVSRIIFEPLMEQDEEGVYQPNLATGVDISDDGLTYTIHLQQNVLFSDGSEMTAQDVLASIAAMGLSENEGISAEAYSNIEGIESFSADLSELPSGLTEDGEDTIEVHFTKATPNNRMILGTRIQKSDFMENADGIQQGEGIGTGAYQLAVTSSGSLASLTANENYREKIGDIQKIEFLSPAYYELADAIDKSEVDVVLYSGSSQLYDIFHDWDGFSVYEEPEDTAYVLFYNQDNAALKSEKVRQAISCSFDRNKASKELDVPGLMLDAGFGPNLKGTEVPKAYSHSTSKAKKLLKEAAKEYPVLESGLTLTLPIVSGSEVQKALAETLQKDLEKIGIELEVKELDQQEYVSALYLTMDFDLYLAGVSITDNMESYQNLYKQSGLPVEVEDSRIADAYETYVKSVTQEQIAQNGAALYEAIDEVQPSLYLGRSRNFISVSADLSGYGIGSYEKFLGQIYKIRVK
jgi:peptide/nickel transport system substrate-binding protein